MVEFKTNEGEKFKFISSVGNNLGFYAIGSEIEILYNPINPQAAEVNSFVLLWLRSDYSVNYGYWF